MKYDYDLICIGLGPAGMAVSIMSSNMGLKVCAIEKHKIGGECMNVGCIPSKAILRIAKTRNVFNKLKEFELSGSSLPNIDNPFTKIQKDLDFISDKKTLNMFDKTDLILAKGPAEFLDKRTVKVNGKNVTAKRIFICTGTKPLVPDFVGIDDIDYLTNENIFSLKEVPQSMIIMGGGAIASEMAQAFSRLGTEVTIVIRGKKIMRKFDDESVKVIEDKFEKEGIKILRETTVKKFSNSKGKVILESEQGSVVEADKILFALGRKMDFDVLKLDNAKVKYNQKGIVVNKKLQTSQSNIYACGDCNGYAMFSHAAMHQGMLALMNSMSIWPVKFNYKNYVVPWTVFTEPQFSFVGMTEEELKAKGKKYTTIKIKYEDYGAAIAENITDGFLKAFISPLGKIYGIYIVGEGSGEMINEWALAVQKKIKIYDIMFLQHSFPTMGFLTKRVSEEWMMQNMKSNFLKKICAFMFRI